MQYIIKYIDIYVHSYMVLFPSMSQLNKKEKSTGEYLHNNV